MTSEKMGSVLYLENSWFPASSYVEVSGEGWSRMRSFESSEPVRYISPPPSLILKQRSLRGPDHIA
jgi:hypothetical protein